MSRWNETHLFHARLSTTNIRNGHQTTTVTTTSHRSHENDCFSGPKENFGNMHQNKARYCEINIRARVVNLRLRCLNERATLWGPPVSIGNGFLLCPLLCWQVCNKCSNWSPLLSGQCLLQALINARYRYVGHPYSNLLPACRLHPGSSQDLATIRGCILEPSRIWLNSQKLDPASKFT
jgi:hypothetical protein